MTKPYSKHSLPWIREAKCSEEPSALKWAYADTEDPEELDDEYAEAFKYRYCHKCPVVLECLAYALMNKEDKGTWGGMTAKERAGFG